jgi:SDR family mycofactocin-dependent oxidoreductase
MGKLDGKVVFVTGAARGQGRAHAVVLAGEGADIIAVDTFSPIDTVEYPLATPEDMEVTVKEVESAGRRIITGDVDVRDLAGLTTFVDAAVGELGRLDIVVANAGIHSAASTLEMTEQMWQEMIDVNLTGVWKTVKASVPHVVAGGRGGSVVLTSSVAAERALLAMAHYGAAKAGVVMLMKTLALELASESIRVNTIHPGTVLSGMVLNDMTFRRFRPELENPTRADFDEASLKRHALPTAGLDCEEIAQLVLYLTSDDSRHVTGSTFYIDAGTRLI